VGGKTTIGKKQRYVATKRVLLALLDRRKEEKIITQNERALKEKAQKMKGRRMEAL